MTCIGRSLVIRRKAEKRFQKAVTAGSEKRLRHKVWRSQNVCCFGRAGGFGATNWGA